MAVFISTRKKISVRTLEVKDASLELIGKANSMLTITLLVTYKSKLTTEINDYLDKDYSQLLQQSSKKYKSKREILVLGSGCATNQDHLYKLVKANEKIKSKLSEYGLKVSGIVAVDCNSKLINEKIKKKIETSSLNTNEGGTFHIYSNQMKKEEKLVRIPCLVNGKSSTSSISEFNIYSTEAIKTNRMERLNTNDCLSKDLSSACTIF